MSDCYVEEDSAINELMEYAHTGPDNPDQEEANFYFALHEFKSIVEKYGTKKVIHELDGETEMSLYHYYQEEVRYNDDCLDSYIDVPGIKVGAGNLQGDTEENPPF
jgi:hypothetical protein